MPIPSLHRRLRQTVAVGLAGLLTACANTAVIGALTPDAGYRVEKDLAYGPEPRQALDLYLPSSPLPDRPLLVFFYGGRWQSGSKAIYPFVGQAFASRGYTVAIPDYRLYPTVRYEGFMRDAAMAVRWLLDHPEVTGAASPRPPLFLMGHSAGAHIAAMLALDQRWLDPDRNAACRLVTAAIGLSGPYDFLPADAADLQQIFGTGDSAAETQPINHVDPTDPPVFLATGADDSTVRPRNTENLAARLRAAGVPVDVQVYPGLAHTGMVAALAAPLTFLAPVRADILAFLERMLANRPDC